MSAVRPAAVAGMFYPGDAGQLSAEIDEMLGGVDSLAPRLGFPKALIVPHAGYVYSGPVAASACAEVEALREVVRRVVLLGPSHLVPLAGLAASTAEAFATPLGEVPVDAEAIRSIAHLTQVKRLDAPHDWEHSLEVQLPFLQRALGGFRLVPLSVGDATPD